jgi:hypothetical protein
VVGDVVLRLLREPGRGDQPVDAVLIEVDVGGVPPAEPPRALDDRREDRVRVACRAADGGENLVDGFELVQQKGVTCLQRLVLLEADGAA